jgi:hypothetical protein
MKNNLSEPSYHSEYRWIKRFTSFLMLCFATESFCQTLTYDDFEGNKSVFYRDKSGVLDSTAKNPKPDAVNNSAHCALYVRNGGKRFDNIKMELKANLTDVSPYATYTGDPPQLKMKIYTSAPVGTLVEILLGRKSGNNDYPAGTNSQYQCYTTKTNEWEELHFLFSQIPQGSETTVSQIDQVTLLFNPNSSSSDTFYFDEITGPPIVSSNSKQIVTPNNTKKKPENTTKQKPNKLSQK